MESDSAAAVCASSHFISFLDAPVCKVVSYSGVNWSVQLELELTVSLADALLSAEASQSVRHE